jgi:hypothetical protein
MWTACFGSRRTRVTPANEIRDTEHLSSATLFNAALPQSIVPSHYERAHSIEILFQRHDPDSTRFQELILNAYLRSLYQMTSIDEQAVNTLIHQVQKLICSRKANASQRLIYLLMQAKKHNYRPLLYRIKRLNQLIFNIERPFDTNKEYLPIFLYTLSNSSIAVLNFQISLGLSHKKDREIKINTLHYLQGLQNTGEAIIKEEWIDLLLTDLLRDPFDISLSALAALFKAQPHFITTDRIKTLTKLFDLSDVNRDRLSHSKIFRVIRMTLEIRPDLIPSFDSEKVFHLMNWMAETRPSNFEVGIEEALKLILAILTQHKNKNYLTQTRFNTLKNWVTHENEWIQIAASKTLNEIYRIAPDFITDETFIEIIPLLQLNWSLKNNEHPKSFNLLATILPSQPMLVPTLLTYYIPRLNSPYETHRCVALRVLMALFSFQPHLSDRTTVTLLMDKILTSPPKSQEMIDGLQAFNIIAMHNMEVIDEEISIEMIDILGQGEWADFYALQTILILLQANPHWITEAHVDLLMQKLQSGVSFIQRNTVRLLNHMIDYRPALLPETMNPIITKALSQHLGWMFRFTEEGTCEALSTLFKAKPELLADENLRKAMSQELNSAIFGKTAHQLLELCLLAADLYPQFEAIEDSKEMGAELFNLYLDSMKLFRPMPEVKQNNRVRMN